MQRCTARGALVLRPVGTWAGHAGAYEKIIILYQSTNFDGILTKSSASVELPSTDFCFSAVDKNNHTHICHVLDGIRIFSPLGIAMPKGSYLTSVFFSFFLSSSFRRHLISEVTEWILTTLVHIFTYDCILKNLVQTPPGIYPQGLGANNRFWDWLWTLTEHISATEHDINNRKETNRTPLHAFQIWWTLVQKWLRTVGEFLPTL